MGTYVNRKDYQKGNRRRDYWKDPSGRPIDFSYFITCIQARHGIKSMSETKQQHQHANDANYTRGALSPPRPHALASQPST